MIPKPNNLFLYLLISFFVGVIVLFANIIRIPSGMEMGAIVPLFFSIVSAIVIFLINVLVSVIVWYVSTTYRHKLIICIQIFFISLVFISSWFICVYKKPPLTEDEIRINREIRYKDALVKTNELFNAAELFKPNDSIVTIDKCKIINGLKELLSFNNQTVGRTSQSDSINIAHINDLFSRHYNSPSLDGHSIVLDSLKINLITYSPNFKHFITVLTYYNSIPDYNSNSYNGLVLFCEKKDNKIFVYSYTNPISQHNESTRDYFYYIVISKHLSIMGNYSLEMEGYKNHLHPFKKEFWSSNYFFDSIQIGNEHYLRYQTLNYYTSDRKYSKRGVFVLN
jgi:hypothetical protein